uniref:cGMP-dependent protein kinase interacting domain-containing protein n=1 Tax=Sinocyclocheilus rhinocerous TaxID=307959 RepID=A0A673IK84_9TELE
IIYLFIFAQELSWRSRIANLQKSDLLGLTHPPGAPRPDRQDADSEERARERRRARARRRGKTGESDDNDPSGEESSGGRDPQTDRHTSSRSDSVLNDCILTRGSESRDFKKVSRGVWLGCLCQQERQERFTDCTARLEMEKKEKKMLERRAVELEEELKVLGDLRADNQRLKDENGALIRVISKLSK